jgi:curli biogenesis system outer membrane secretion channel CsgG
MGIISEETAKQIGKHLGAEMVLVGSLTAVRPIKKRDSMGSSMWRETRGYEISLQGRLTDIVRGEIIAATKATGMEAQQEKMAFGAKTGIIAPDETLLNKAMESAVKILVQKLAGQIIPKSGS